ncbi:hypothetical protein AX17_005687 [Amanita inopinata Kibby_2008]|nr:hypothetical protein AX17_005687 [Amanita inopinata Kibby_2008]
MLELKTSWIRAYKEAFKFDEKVEVTGKEQHFQQWFKPAYAKAIEDQLQSQNTSRRSNQEDRKLPPPRVPTLPPPREPTLPPPQLKMVDTSKITADPGMFAGELQLYLAALGQTTDQAKEIAILTRVADGPGAHWA